MPPTVAITSSVDTATTLLKAGQSTTLTFTVSEATSDLTGADFAVAGGTLGPLQQSATNPLVYTATFTATSGTTSNTTASVSIASDKFSDAAGNFNKDGQEANNTWASAVTPAAINPTAGKLDGASDSGVPGDNKTNDATPTMSGTVPAGSTATVTINGQTYPVTVNPDGTWNFTQPTNLPDGTYTPVINVTPAGGGAPTSTPITPFTIDTTAPTIAITADKTALAAGQTSVITFTLSEASSDFTSADIVSTGGSLGPLVQSTTNPLVYTATFTPNSTGTAASITVDSAKFSDAAANSNKDTSINPAPSGAVYEANNQVTLAINQTAADTTPPTIVVARTASGTLTSSETITFTLSEASKDFTQADLTSDSGTFSNFTAVPTSGSASTGYTQYTATFTPASSSSGQATLGVLAGKFADAAGNLNKDTYQLSASTDVLEDNNKVLISFNTLASPTPAPDTTPPSVVVARAGTGSLATGNTDTITFTLSENSLSFDQTDVTVVGGVLTNWTAVASSGSPTSGYHLYSATFVPTAGASGTATIGVKDHTFKDAAGNSNLDTYESNIAGTTTEANNVVSLGFNTTTPDTSERARKLAMGQTKED